MSQRLNAGIQKGQTGCQSWSETQMAGGQRVGSDGEIPCHGERAWMHPADGVENPMRLKRRSHLHSFPFMWRPAGYILIINRTHHQPQQGAPL